MSVLSRKLCTVASSMEQEGGASNILISFYLFYLPVKQIWLGGLTFGARPTPRKSLRGWVCPG